MLGELGEAGYAAHEAGKWHLDPAGCSVAARGDDGFADDTWYDLTHFYDKVDATAPNRFGGCLRGLEDERVCFAHHVADRSIDLLQRRSEPIGSSPTHSSTAAASTSTRPTCSCGASTPQPARSAGGTAC